MAVEELVAELAHYHPDLVIISGGAQGIDSFAERAARISRVRCAVYRPKGINRDSTRLEVTRAMYARNEEIAAAADLIHAFVSSDRKGGTENTIKAAAKLGKTVVIHERPVPEVAP